MGTNKIKRLFGDIFSNQAQRVEDEIYLNEVDKFLKDVDQDKYFSRSQSEMLKLSYEEVYRYFKKRRYFKKGERVKQFLHTYQSLEGYRKNHNQKYLKNELERQDSFFSDIDGKSLDYQQREAVVVDEDNNLIVAGAGSGKTLTISAKVSYLVKCLKVDPKKILLITFTNKAAKEMEERIVKKLGIEVDVKTFHSLGKQIIVEVKKNPSICDNSSQITGLFICDRLAHNMKLLNKLVKFYGNYLNIPKDMESFDNFGEYLESQQHINLKTLKGIRQEYIDLLTEQGVQLNHHQTLKNERVKSAEELALANFFFLNGIRYEYEPPYKYSTETKEKRQYHPDFYLVDYNIYIEHFGINRQEKTPWLSNVEEEKYLEGIEWKRKLHKKNGTHLYETYSYQFSDGTIFEKLTEDLDQLGVEFKGLQSDELLGILEGLKTQVGFNEFIKLLNTFLNLFKSNGYDENDIENMLKVAKKNKNRFIRKREILFFEIFREFYQYYQETLERQKSIDFNDMINDATKLVERGEVSLDYQYIIIDEYQDISQARYKLVKVIKDKTHAKIMAVGDDWQSIYRFAGSDIKLFTDFEKMFGASELLKIERTYRNSQQVIDLAGSFVMKNPIQLKKKLKSDKQLNHPIRVICYKNQEQALLKALEHISQPASPKRVMLLGRNNSDLNFLRNNASPYFKVTKKNGEDRVECRAYKNLIITFVTVHKSKGLEADEVIVLNCNNDTCGFPNKISDDLLLRYVLTDADSYPYGEERRLFYVALTRTKNRCILLASEQQSEFVKELVNEYHVPLEMMEEKQVTNVKCPYCKTGHLVMRNKGFLGCSNYPGCNKTINYIEILNNPIECPECGGYLVKRRSRFGEFMGCINYPKCAHQENLK